MNQDKYIERFYISASCLAGKLGWCYFSSGGDFVLGKMTGDMEKRGLIKALREALESANPVFRTMVMTSHEEIASDFEKFAKKPDDIYKIGTENMDLWHDVFLIIKNRLGFVGVKRIMEGECDEINMARKMARKAVGHI